MDWLKYKKLYFTISAILIAISGFALAKWGLKQGLEFRGGSIIEYQIDEEFSTEEVSRYLEEEGLEIASIQTTSDDTYLFRFAPMSTEEKEKADTIIDQTIGEANVQELRYETVGPSVGPELIQKTIYAVVIATFSILLWIAYQFRNMKFGMTAVLAMLHDTFILVGSFALLGHYFGAEVDFLFVTALLTTLSFSVHDTIVVYDRIRETIKKEGGEIRYLVNKAVSETMVRSLNNSFTILFMLIALILLGGTTVKWFAVALFIGTVLGTYSSPFIAAPLLVTWEDNVETLKEKRSELKQKITSVRFAKKRAK